MLQRASSLAASLTRRIKTCSRRLKSDDAKGSINKTNKEQQDSLEKAKSILDEINRVARLSADALQKPDIGKGGSKKVTGKNLDSQQLLTKGLAENERVKYFNVAKVNNLRAGVTCSTPNLKRFQQNRYDQFCRECYDDGYNKRWENVRDGTSVQLPTTNEEGERHRQIAKTPWEELVFLDEHIHEMPKDGPLAVFFDAVTDGLSQNPFISKEEKLEHLEWFRQYFVKFEEDLLNFDAVQPGDMDSDPILLPGIDDNGKEVWPSQKAVMERYEEMTCWGKNWYDSDLGPMRFRIRERQARLAKLEELFPDSNVKDKKGELMDDEESEEAA